ncbi:hypothetical protein N9L68_04815 [bacterium]|nr:hypothetical protein [bacterium]
MINNKQNNNNEPHLQISERARTQHHHDSSAALSSVSSTSTNPRSPLHEHNFGTKTRPIIIITTEKGPYPNLQTSERDASQSPALDKWD